MPGKALADKNKNFVLIFSTMLGAIAIARISTDLEQQQNLLDTAREHLLRMF